MLVLSIGWFFLSMNKTCITLYKIKKKNKKKEKKTKIKKTKQTKKPTKINIYIRLIQVLKCRI
jgi:hypothetical protein